ncbi:MAG: hypothetical protein IJE10_07045 [Clostridia bacterium]|nr:hypothetical protein [Clostridia bacterium]
MMNKIYGDGIHDDTKGLQELIDTSDNELYLPMPDVHYLISKPLELPSNFKLKLPRYAEIKLAKASNCVMLKNKTVTDCSKRVALELFDFINEYSPDYPCKNIEVEGGIWNFNNKEQTENPILSGNYDQSGYRGFMFLFYNVKGLRISSLTLKDPVTFAVTLDSVSYFTVDNVVFDFNYGNPLATNMDGIHLNGNCHFGEIRNLKGACHDDLVALNADEGSVGEISNVLIDGIYAEDCHSAVRLLSANHPVKNVHITNVFGTYYQYCIGITRFYPTEGKGFFDGITIDNIYASKAVRLPVYGKPATSYVYPLIYIQNKLYIKALKISNLNRREENVPVETIFVGDDTIIEQMILDNITTENHTESKKMPMVVNNGEIKHLYKNAVFEDDTVL